MVNTGFPSKDCHTCRRRRVKCDLRRPGCIRCEKIGQSCSGYRDLEHPGFSFRVQTPSSYAVRSIRKSREQPGAIRDRQTEAMLSKSSTFDTRLCKLSPSPQLVESWDMHIMPLVVRHFTFPTKEGIHAYGSLECFPELIRNLDTESPLYLACHATGYAYLANRTHSSSLTLTHRIRYGRALRAVGRAICDPDLQKQDSTLLAVWVLCFYELLLGTTTSVRSDPGPVNWDAHSKAMAGLLRVRGRQQFKSKNGCQLFHLAYHTIQIQSLQTCQQPPPEAPDWFDTIYSSANLARIPFLPLFLYGDEVARICSRVKSLIEEGSPENMLFATTDIVRASNDLECSMRDHFGHGLPYPLLNSATRSVVVENQNSHSDLRLRNYMDACLLRLHYSVLELLFHVVKLPNSSVAEREDIENLRQINTLQSQARADRILTTLPLFLPRSSTESKEPHSSWADGLRLMWPLRLIASSPVVRNGQKTAAESALSRIGYELGIMQAVGTYYSTITAYEIL